MILDESSEPVTSFQYVPLTTRDKSLSLMYLQYPEHANASRVAEFTNNAIGLLVFPVTIPPVGYSTYRMIRSSAAKVAAAQEKQAAATAARMDRVLAKQPKPAALASAKTSAKAPAADTSINNDFYRVDFDPQTGTVSMVTNLQTGVIASVAITGKRKKNISTVTALPPVQPKYDR